MEIASKLLMKLRLEIASTMFAGAQPVKKLSTSGVPLTVKIRQTTAVSTKAMTWFLVSAEKALPIAR